jgi:hypothetical protein
MSLKLKGSLLTWLYLKHWNLQNRSSVPCCSPFIQKSLLKFEHIYQTFETSNTYALHHFQHRVARGLSNELLRGKSQVVNMNKLWSISPSAHHQEPVKLKLCRHLRFHL